MDRKLFICYFLNCNGRIRGAIGKHLTRHKISYGARQRASLQVEGCSYAKQGNRTCAVSCIPWLGRFGTRGERCDVSLFQITLQAFELLVIPDFRHVCDAAPIIGTNFEEERMSNLLSKMNSYSYCI